ncbi:MAG: hypothetical protein HN948_02905 [Clostridia bacterium]|nr:hypothetical protein [Clostridia bacterium]MBT7121941.1 hypothetical protein [Clostridia bacterium]
MTDVKATFPHLGNYFVPLEVLFTAGIEVDYIVPPPITNRTLELGTRHSPDFVCTPFKYNLGNYIESLEAGANTLVQVGGACRLDYYGELHEQILRDLGYDFRFVNIGSTKLTKPLTFYNILKEINPDMTLKNIARVLPVVLKMIQYIDEAEDFIRKNIGFERNPGEFDHTHQRFLLEMRSIRSKKELYNYYIKYMNIFKSIEVDKPKKPLRVGVIGEYYTIMVPFSNHFIEKELATMGIVIDRWMNLTNSVIHDFRPEAKEHIKNYVTFDMGATAMYTIDKALQFAKKGYDGIIHVKSFGCTPETDAIPVLQNISSDYKIPILYFSFDSQTSEIGIKTRLEAFYDMIIMRKEAV